MSINVTEAVETVRQEAAKRLLRAALFFQAQHQQRLGVSNPRPHKTPSRPGEYPRKRTGAGQASVVYGRPADEHNTPYLINRAVVDALADFAKA